MMKEMWPAQTPLLLKQREHSRVRITLRRTLIRWKRLEVLPLPKEKIKHHSSEQIIINFLNVL